MQSIGSASSLSTTILGLVAGQSCTVNSTLLVDNFYVTASPVITSVVPPSPVTVGTPYTHAFTAAGTGPMTFSKTVGTLPPGLTLSSDGVLSGTPTTVGTGVYPGITVRVFGGAPSNSSQTFSLSVTTTAANYLVGYGLTGANAALTVDPNGDGVTNLMAYALGLNPTVPSANTLPKAAIKNYAGVPYLYLNFNRSSAATDLTYFVEASSDLINWNLHPSAAPTVTPTCLFSLASLLPHVKSVFPPPSRGPARGANGWTHPVLRCKANARQSLRPQHFSGS